MFKLFDRDLFILSNFITYFTYYPIPDSWVPFNTYLDICLGVGLLDHMVPLFVDFKEPLYHSPL